MAVEAWGAEWGKGWGEGEDEDKVAEAWARDASEVVAWALRW